jgi:hypothetical protein
MNTLQGKITSVQKADLEKERNWVVATPCIREKVN